MRLSKTSMNMNEQNSSNDELSNMRLCNNCTSKSCCTDFAEPLLFPSDLKKLAKIKGSSSDHIKEIVIDNRHIKVIKKGNDSKSCIFLNKENNFCSIYENRPFDCRMYPFDMIWINNEYHWIIYTCNPNSDWSWTEKHLKKLEEDPQFNEVMRNRDVFRLVSINYIGITTKIPLFVILRKVGF